ncbi:hypothetical protein [Mesorhizobium sp.]|uniref:hypothetical protein n=1 Tax=Mesorhizobium sp. TaxID=1871066 RepID=UPI0025CC07A0|nr:hypothetical protein [Mesorhizobium sp.]
MTRIKQDAARARLIFRVGVRTKGIANGGSDGKPKQGNTIGKSGNRLDRQKGRPLATAPDLNRAWEEEKPIRLCRMMRLVG